MATTIVAQAQVPRPDADEEDDEGPAPRRPVGESERPAALRFDIVWASALAAPPAARATYDPEHAYIPLRNGTLVAVSLSGGNIGWSTAISSELPVATDERLVFAGSNGTIQALSASDGAVRWRASVAAALAVPPHARGGWLVVGTTSGDILALHGATGEIVWRQPVGANASAAAAIAADRVYVPLSDGRVLAMDLKTGVRVWERKLGGIPAEILPLDDRLFVGSDDNFFYCLALDDGDVKWRWRTGGDIIGLPVVDEKRVYFVSLDTMLRALDRGNGTQRWKRALPTRPATGPLVSGESVAVSGISPEIGVYRREDGKPVGVITAPAEIAGAPHFSRTFGGFGASVFIVTGDGRVLALGRSPDPPLVPFRALPGTRMPPERASALRSPS